MHLCCSCLESCFSPADARTKGIPIPAPSVRDPVNPDVSGLGRPSTVPSAPFENGAALSNAPNSIIAENIRSNSVSSSAPSTPDCVVPDVSGLSSTYTVPSAPSDNDTAFFNAPNGIRAGLEKWNKNLQNKAIRLLSVSKASAFGVSYLLKCQLTETTEIIHVKCWSNAVGRLIITDVLRNLNVNDPLVLS